MEGVSLQFKRNYAEHIYLYCRIALHLMFNKKKLVTSQISLFLANKKNAIISMEFCDPKWVC